MLSTLTYNTSMFACKLIKIGTMITWPNDHRKTQVKYSSAAYSRKLSKPILSSLLASKLLSCMYLNVDVGGVHLSHCYFYRPRGKVIFSEAVICLWRDWDLLPERPPSPPDRDPPSRQRPPILQTETPSPPDWDPPPDRDLLGLTSSGGHYSSRYASYWNAFLYKFISSQ